MVFLMKKANISWAATLQNKNCRRNFTQKYYKINLFCKKKQDFSAARTPQYKWMFFFIKILHHWITCLKKKKSKTHKLINHIHSFLEQFYKNTRLIFAQNLEQIKKNSSLSSKNKLRTNEKEKKKSKLIKETKSCLIQNDKISVFF